MVRRAALLMLSPVLILAAGCASDHYDRDDGEGLGSVDGAYYDRPRDAAYDDRVYVEDRYYYSSPGYYGRPYYSGYGGYHRGGDDRRYDDRGRYDNRDDRRHDHDDGHHPPPGPLPGTASPDRDTNRPSPPTADNAKTRTGPGRGAEVKPHDNTATEHMVERRGGSLKK